MCVCVFDGSGNGAGLHAVVQ